MTNKQLQHVVFLNLCLKAKMQHNEKQAISKVRTIAIDQEFYSPSEPQDHQ